MKDKQPLTEHDPTDIDTQTVDEQATASPVDENDEDANDAQIVPDDQYYEIERILGSRHRGRPRNREFIVSWTS